MKQVLSILLALLNFTLFITVIPLSFMAAMLGLQGHLSDTSEHENRLQGVMFLVIVLVTLSCNVVCFFACRKLFRSKSTS